MLKEWINSNFVYQEVNNSRAIHIAAANGHHDVCVVLHNTGSDMNP
jgi:hypothetical protein